MKLKITNENYAGRILRLDNKHNIPKKDFIQLTYINGAGVIIGKDMEIGSLGLYIPPETQLSEEYCRMNNLNSEKEKNLDTTKSGYIGKKRRVKVLKFAGVESVGMFVPLDTLKKCKINTSNLKEGDIFNSIEGKEFFIKYIPVPNVHIKGKQFTPKKPFELVDNQFRFHYKTGQLGFFVNKIKEHDIISITDKWHGTSGISAYLLTKRKLSLIDKLLIKFGVKVKDTEYRYLHSSRKVIKYVNKADIYGLAHKVIEPHLTEGLSVFYEIVGFRPGGGTIQKGYHYGMKSEAVCKYGINFDIVIYRITLTDSKGIVTELTARGVQKWCKEHDLKAVKEWYYGTKHQFMNNNDDGLDFLGKLKKYYHNECAFNEGMPSEGVVVRVEDTGYTGKYKNFDFLKRESKALDKEELNIEDNQ